MWAADSKDKGSDDGSDDEEDSEGDSEEDSDEDGPSKGAVTREERKQAAKARKEAAIARKKAQAVEVGDMPPSDSEEDSDDDDDEMPANPNHSKAARSQTTVGDVTEGVSQLSTATNRKERESAEAALAKEKYRQLHEQGKTDEAKADLARLKLIREQREADAARKQVSSHVPFRRRQIRLHVG